MTVDYIKLDCALKDRGKRSGRHSGGQEATCYWHLHWS